MFPLPLEASPFRDVIEENVLVSEATVSFGVFADEPPEPLFEEPPPLLLPQAASTRPAVRATEKVAVVLVLDLKQITSLVSPE